MGDIFDAVAVAAVIVVAAAVFVCAYGSFHSHLLLFLRGNTY